VLGDIHNLFGDTDAANVALREDGSHELNRLRRGDTTDVMLDYVGYSLDALRAAYEEKVNAVADLPNREVNLLLAALEAGLTGYTYLHETPFE
jgi:arginine decarboxylase